MQGRLVPPLAGRIQAFPWDVWRDEFRLAHQAGFGLMEWTIDADGIHENPLMTPSGRAEIQELSLRYQVTVVSLTGDFLMRAPVHKAQGKSRESRLGALLRVIEAAAAAKVDKVVVPLVDEGRIETAEQEAVFCEIIFRMNKVLAEARVQLLIESDYPPAQLRAFMSRLSVPQVGVNYDIGNSASLGFDPGEEVTSYGARIRNVHVKDRMRGGTTVPFGVGAADFPRVFRLLSAAGYPGNFILQPARAADEDHVGLLSRYRDMVQQWLGQAA